MRASIITLIISFFFTITMQGTDTSTSDKAAVAVLNKVLTGSHMFVKAHAAEYLIWTGHPQSALKEYLNEEKLHGTEPKYRIVIWRVLVQAEPDPARKKMWLEKIYHAYNDVNGPDRIHATETLAKLKQAVSDLFPQTTQGVLASKDSILRTYGLWAGGYGSEARIHTNKEKCLEMALTDTDITIKKISAYVLRNWGGLNEQEWGQLNAAALKVKPDDAMFTSYLASAIITAPAGTGQHKIDQLKHKMVSHVNEYDAGHRIDLAQTLAQKGTAEDLPLLADVLHDKNVNGKYQLGTEEAADLHAAAAYAILKIRQREK